MSAERIDHAAVAIDLLEKQSHWPSDRDGNDPESDRVIQEAQVHATLALAEQQLTANLIEFASVIAQAGTVDQVDDEMLEIGDRIRKALGLS